MDYIVNKLIQILRLYPKCSFYCIRRKLAENNINLDKKALIKRLENGNKN
jgi:hypothetical protein